MSAFTLELEERGLLADAQAICKPLHLRVDELRAKSTAKAYVEARRAMARLLKERGWSLNMIGALLQRDHASVATMINGGRGKGES